MRDDLYLQFVTLRERLYRTVLRRPLLGQVPSY